MPNRIQRSIVKSLQRASLFVVTATLLLSGCHRNSASNAAPLAGSPVQAAPVINPATAGSITGVVHFTGKAPERIPIDMSADPACAMTGGKNLTEQYIVNNGKLANVFVYIKSGIAPWQAASDAPPAVMDQKGCRYVPHVLGIQQGGKVEFRNSDPTSHNVHTLPQNPANQSVDLSEMAGSQPQTETFHAPELMIPVRCNNHPWMQAFINVAPNAFFAVTGPDGSFTLHGLPPGTYTVAAVHEKLGEQDIQVTVPPKSTATADFTYAAK